MPRHPRHAPTADSLSDRVYGSLVAEARLRAGRDGGDPQTPGPAGPIHALNVGDTYLEPLPAARAEAQKSAGHPRLHNYAPVQGEAALLDAIVARVRRTRGIDLDREGIQVMPGATAGFTVVCATLLDPGDEVVVLAPFWPLIRGIIASRGATPVEVPFHDRVDAPGFDAEAVIEAAVGPRTVAVYVNSPNNPTGRVLPRPVVDAIARVAARHDLWVLCDEAYDDLYYTSERPEAVWAHPGVRDRAVACHTLSKSYALAGARVGFTHGPLPVMSAIRGVQTFLTYGAPRPLQLGAARALAEGDAWVDEARALYAEAGRRAAAALGLPAPAGGTFLFMDAAPHFREGEDLQGFLRRCLDAGVLLTPGPASGRDYATWVRLCFTVVPPVELDDALARLRTVIHA
jgi:N-succinyldiaminopimelate aminotransferase